jgi:SUN family beta-glucosidase
MKATVHVALVASLAAGALAQPHAHQHQHYHDKRHVAHQLEARAATCVTNYVVDATATVYVVGDQQISEDDAKKGMDAGYYISIGETDPTYSTPAPSQSSTSSSAQGGQFKESPQTSTAAAASQTSSSSASSQSSGASNTGGTGLTANFPSGQIPCSQFPSQYGAVPVPWMNLNGWSGIQKTPSYRPGDGSISYIVTGVGGDKCEAGSFCSYACPVGWQKEQWPTAQGSTLQSIGGLFCNANGMLELTRPEVPTLCGQGAGGVFIKNDMDADCSVCRTDYPGTENMVIPLLASPGTTTPLTNPYSPNYYYWNGSPTTAQYYVNKKGYGLADACVWTSSRDPTGAGNWSPVNIGLGKNAQGITYLSIFANIPTTSAQLDFNIEITGDISAPCALVNGVYTGGGNGCTVSQLQDGDTGTIADGF